MRTDSSAGRDEGELQPRELLPEEALAPVRAVDVALPLEEDDGRIPENYGESDGKTAGTKE